MKRERPRNCMSFGELREKEVVCIADGRRLGYVCDIEFDPFCGRILRLLLPPAGRYITLFGSKDYINIPWESIERIGSDVILVKGDCLSDTRQDACNH